MSTSVNIERVQQNDLDELTSLLHAAKFSLSINRLIIEDWPNNPVQKKLYRGAVEGALREKATEDWKAVDKDTGDIAGYIALTIQEPREKTENSIDESEAHVPEGIVPGVYKAVTDATSVITKATPNIRHVGKSGSECSNLPNNSLTSNSDRLYLCETGISTWRHWL